MLRDAQNCMAHEANAYTFWIRICKSENVCATVCATKDKEEKPRKRSVFGGLASPARFERAASRLGGERSIRLSYRDIYSFYALLSNYRRCS